MNKSIAVIFLIFFTVHSSSAQNLNGYWKGTLSMRGCFPENNIELQISLKGNNANGDSYHYQDVYTYVKKKFNGNYNRNTRKLNLQEDLITTYHIPGQCVICIKNYDLTYSRNNNIETLSGNWTGIVQNSNNSCESGRIILTRIAESAFKAIPEILVDTGTIRLDFYDNAQVDGDSITILVDKRVVLTHQRLSGKPVAVYLKIDLYNSFHEVEMMAENLGTIPPNTAVLVITAGEKRHLLYLSSSASKSAMVRFVYDGDATKRHETVAVSK